MRSHVVIPTDWGKVTLAWTKDGIVRLDLPREAAMGADKLVHYGTAVSTPRGFAAEARRRITAYFAGENVDLDDLPVDFDGVGPFARKVYEVTRTIPRGRTASYGEIARRCEHPRAARAVGTALKNNPLGLIIPCHRVVAAGQKIGGFSGGNGISLKRKLLALEGELRLGEAKASVRR